MNAPERIRSGIPGLDHALAYIRMGDNVVWRLSSLTQFALVVDPFVIQALREKRNVIYIRFASHSELVPEQQGITRYTLDPYTGFESFASSVHTIITKEGPGAFYVFDCLSELQTIWNADPSVKDFFRMTCPYLYRMKTVAYFPLIRSKHSRTVITGIRDTTQLLIDLYGKDGSYYIHPLKVYKRHSQTMFSPHRFDPSTGSITPLRNQDASEYYAIVDDEKPKCVAHATRT